jgi:dGTPase
VAESRGRRYPELPHPYRNEFQRDRDRVIHARAFRRLEKKTQVFPPDLSDHFRNRLTHTMEVAQIARTVASVLELDEDLTEALALAHDIGHPPFAHAGEEELDRAMQRYGEHFDHNIHALRIVEVFEQRYARFPGLNLTFEVREGIVKHSSDIPADAGYPLNGYLPGLKPPIEAQLIDIADEIAYNAGDLDDGYSAGLIRVSDLCCDIPQYEEIWTEIETSYPGAPEHIRFNEVLRRLIDWLASGFVEGTFHAAADLYSVEAVRSHNTRVACFTPAAAETNAALKRFLSVNVYQSDVVRHQRLKTAGMLTDLFEYFMEHPEQILERDDDSPLHRAVCDYIAGMTDPFFHRMHRAALGAA